MANLFPACEINSEARYFAITLGADENGKCWAVTQTQFRDFKDPEKRIEVREMSCVRPEIMAANWESFRQPFSVVNDDTSFVRWRIGGGHALITEEQVRKHIPREFEPRLCVLEGAFGFTNLENLPKTAFQKAPTAKLRMRVLKRDQYRCMICGQRPANDVNIQLHTHHIRPHGSRGVTTEKNLISLCHTCHAGLEPHYEFTLFDLIENVFSESDGQLIKRELEKYVRSVQNYRKALHAHLFKGHM